MYSRVARCMASATQAQSTFGTEQHCAPPEPVLSFLYLMNNTRPLHSSNDYEPKPTMN